MSNYIRIAVAVAFAGLVIFAIPSSYHLPLLGLVLAMVAGEQLLARYQTRRRKVKPKDTSKKRYLIGHANDQIEGRFFSVFEWNLIFRPLASLAATTLLLFVLFVFDMCCKWLFGIEGLWGFVYFAVGITAFLFIVFTPDVGKDEVMTKREEEKGEKARKGVEVVPPAYVALNTFWGWPLKWFREAGEYSWTGKYILLGRMNDPVDAKTGVGATDKDGFYFSGDIQMKIWNSSTEENKTRLQAPAKDSTEIFTEIVLTFYFYDIMKWVQNSNPILDIGERARAALRAAISFFTGRDNAGLKNVLTRLMAGESIVTAFISKATGEHKAGSVIRDRSGSPMYQPVHAEVFNEPTEEEVLKAKELFRQRIEEESDAEMREAVSNDGTSYVVDKTINETLDEVLERTGLRLRRASIGQIEFSPPVKNAADLAASEEFQAIARRLSAAGNIAAVDRIAQIYTKLGPDTFRAIMAYVAAEDNPDAVKVNHVFGIGDNDIAKALVAAGENHKKGGEK